MIPGGALSLIIFVDALGWRISQRYPLLEDLLPRRGPMDSVLGYSSTCIPTILTGLSPREHGHFSFFQYDPPRSPFKHLAPLRRLPQGLTRRGRVRRLMSQGLQRVLGYSGYFQLYNVPFEHLPLFDYSEKRDLYQPGGINSGAPTIFDALRRQGIPAAVSDWRRPEAENIEAMKAALAGPEPVEFAYLYLADLDGILHANGSCAEPVERKIQWYDAQLRGLIRFAERRYSEVRVHLFSDHGMTDIHELCDLIGAVEGLGLTFGEDYAAMYDATMARFWILNERARRPLIRQLEGERRGRILTAEELKAHGCDFPDGRQGDLTFLVDPGVLICPSYMGATPVAGMHGYEPTHADSVALYATNVKGHPMPQRLHDLFDLMQAEAEAARGARAQRGAA